MAEIIKEQFKLGEHVLTQEQFNLLVENDQLEDGVDYIVIDSKIEIKDLSEGVIDYIERMGNIPIASNSTLGVIKVGENLEIAGDGTLNAIIKDISLDNYYTKLETQQEINNKINELPSWTKEPTKPTYTANEVGALPADTPLFDGDYNSLENKPELFSGDYNDLTNKPIIPDTSIFITKEVNDLVNYYNSDTIDSIEEELQTAIITHADNDNIHVTLTDKANWNNKADASSVYTKENTYSRTEIDGKIVGIYRFKGSVNNYDSLPTTNLTVGDVWDTRDTSRNYAWDGTKWDSLGSIVNVDLSDYLTETETNTLIDNKVNTAIGNLPEWSKEPTKPTYTAEEVGALPNTTEIFSGDYNDLTNKPYIPQALSDLNDDIGVALEVSVAERLEDKVDKEVGKGLSTNDYTTVEKTKLESLENYDDTEVRGLISDNTDLVNTKQDELVSGTNIKTINNQSILGNGNIEIESGAGEFFYTNTDPSVIAVGGIAIGTEFDNVPLQTLFDNMFYPEQFPNLSNPTVNLSENAPTTIEVGQSINFNLTASFNQGTISPAYGTTGKRSGLPTSYVFSGTDSYSNTVTTSALSGVVSSLTNIVSNTNRTLLYKVRVNYLAGPQPLSSKGNNYNSPLPAGYKDSSNVSITAVYPIYATTSNISTLTKQSLTSSKIITVSMVGESETEKQTCRISKNLGVATKIETLNTLSGKWDTLDLSSFTRTEININTSYLTGTTYYEYKHNGDKIGARQIRFTIT